MKSLNIHSNSSKRPKRNKHRRFNAMKNSVRDRMPPHIFNAQHKNKNYENINRISKNNIQIDPNFGLKRNLKNDTPIYFSKQKTKTPEVKLCSEIMTLMPYSNIIQNENDQMAKNSSILLARLTMNAIAASETDINALLELVETMYNSIQAMLQDVKQKHQIYEPSKNIVQEPRYVIKIDLKKFIKYLNDLYIRKREIMLRNQNNKLTNKGPCLCYPANKCMSFNILLQRRRMSFNISVCKFNSCSMDFFRRLATFYKSCNMTCNKAKSKPVPSVFIRDWHFRNVSQGYFLSILLKHNNVMSLNVMRKLYFVIITSVTPNLTIEINFKLANGIFTSYDTPPFEKLPFEVIHWNDGHRNVLENSTEILPAFTYNIRHNAESNDNLQRNIKSDNTLLNDDDRCSSDSSSTLKYESSSEYEGSDYFVRSTSYSETGFLDLKSTERSTNLTMKDSVKTLTLSIDDMLSFHALVNTRQDCGDMNFGNRVQEQYNLYNSRIQQSRTWMSKVFKDYTNFKSKVVLPFFNSMMNETVFDRITITLDGHVGSFTQYWTLLNSKTFCKTFVKDLGKYLVNTFLISVIYC